MSINTLTTLPDTPEITENQLPTNLKEYHTAEKNMVEELNETVEDILEAESNCSDYADTSIVTTANTYKQYIQSRTNYKGDWVSGSNYSENDSVTYNNLWYRCKSSITNSTTAPPSDTSHFEQIPTLQKVIGNLNNCLFYAPLKNSLDIVRGTGSITLERVMTGATAHTYIDRYGVLQKVTSANVARFEADGLLIEGSSTNLLYPSENLNDSNWLKYNCSIETSATITLPDGTSGTNCGIIADTSLNQHHVRICVTSSETTITGSVFLKKGNKSYAMLEIAFREEDYTFIKDCYGRINLETGELFGLNSMSNVSMEMEIKECAYDWYRVIIKATYSGSITVGKISLEIFSCISDGGTTYTGDGNSVEIYAWGAQLEQKPFATSYIPTTTASATRNADICYVQYDNNVPLIGDNKTIAMDFDVLGILGTSSGTEAQVLYYAYKHFNNIEYWLNAFANYAIYGVATNDGAQYNEATNIYTYFDVLPNTSYRFIRSLNGLTGKVYINGELLNSISSNGIKTKKPTTQLYLGCDVWENRQLYGHISNIRIWDFALTDIEAQLA